MIRVKYLDGRVEEYKSPDHAKFMVMTELFSSRGQVLPMAATEVKYFPETKVYIERDLHVQSGEIKFD